MKTLLPFFCLILAHNWLRAYPTDSVGLDRRYGQLYILYRIEQGDKVESIAQRYRATSEELRACNIFEKTGLVVGQIIRIPYSDKNVSPQQLEAITAGIGGGSVVLPTNTKERKLHKVVAGDTYFSIAKRYGMKLDDLLKLNKRTEKTNLLKGEEIMVEVVALTAKPTVAPKTSPTEQEWIHRPAVSPETLYERKEVIYKVKKGETLNMISQKYKVNVDSLRKWNKLGNTNNVAEGSSLIVAIEFKDKDGLVKVRYGGERLITPDNAETIKTAKQPTEIIAEVNGVPTLKAKDTKKQTLTTIKDPIPTIEQVIGKADILPSTLSAMPKLYIHFSNNKRGCSAVITNTANNQRTQVKIAGDVDQVAKEKGLIARMTTDVARQLKVTESQMTGGILQVKVECTCGK